MILSFLIRCMWPLSPTPIPKLLGSPLYPYFIEIFLIVTWGGFLKVIHFTGHSVDPFKLDTGVLHFGVILCYYFNKLLLPFVLFSSFLLEPLLFMCWNSWLIFIFYYLFLVQFSIFLILLPVRVPQLLLFNSFYWTFKCPLLQF